MAHHADIPELQQRAIRLLGEDPSMTFRDVAKELHVHYNTLTTWNKQDWFREAWTTQREEILSATKDQTHDFIAGNIDAVAQRMMTLVASEDEAVAFRASKWVLEHFYGKPKEQKDVTHGGVIQFRPVLTGGKVLGEVEADGDDDYSRASATATRQLSG